MNDDLTAKIAEFCHHLRTYHHFTIGPREMQEAVRAVEIAGVRERVRVASALRAVCCSRMEEREIFDRAFAAFFNSQPIGIEQPRHARERRTTRPDRSKRREDREGTPAAGPQPAAPGDENGAGTLPAATSAESLSPAQAWELRRAKYSPAPARAETMAFDGDGFAEAVACAQRLVSALRLVRSPRWRPVHDGARFDLRRTLHASLRTGGDIIEPHFLGHPPRHPSFVVLLDASRSMSEYAPRMLAFARALCRRTRRAGIFLFSTSLREVTRELRNTARMRAYRLEGLGDAWGGGTRIGASLAQCLRRHGGRLNDRTYVIVISDGLDVGEISLLRRAIGQISRRCAGVAWLNPHAAASGFVPAAGGMRAALPFVTLVSSLDELTALRTRLAVTAGA
ncbi:MAG: VWA domain-containing protein [Candidatus Cybelea sp.]